MALLCPLEELQGHQVIHPPADNNDPCCEDCLAWYTAEDAKPAQWEAMQEAINAAYDRLKAASTSYSLQHGLFVIRKDAQ